MVNMVSYLLKCLSLLVLSKCYGIGIEYYDNQDLSTIQAEYPIGTDARRYGTERNTSCVKHNYSDDLKSNRSTIYNSMEHYKYIHSIEERISESEPIGETSNAYTSNLLSTFVGKSDTVKEDSEVTVSPLDMLKEYEYVYDDDSKPNTLLRQHTNMLVHETDTNLENNKKNPLTEFYNLEPAVLHVNLSNNYSKSNNLWYVQEDVPCWELPVLYGEPSKRKKYSDIFLLHGGELKNVIEKTIINDISWSSYKRTTPPLSYYTSKWCTVEPCYGDHTLCLFSDKTTSSLCDKKYEIKIPTISEQTAVVNTLNSMRNMIANGKSDRYSNLPTAANMKQIIYDYDLEQIAKVWLHQCLPGPAPCSALDGTFVTQLECTKYAKYCCLNSSTTQFTKCTPKPECFVLPVIGCLHVWFWSAGDNLSTTDVLCGHTSQLTYNTAQVLWATTNKIGCAYAQNSLGDIRVICNFSPGAPFIIDSKYYCGILGYKENPQVYGPVNIIDPEVLLTFGIDLKTVNKRSEPNVTTYLNTMLRDFDEHSDNYWGINVLTQIYKEGWVREKLKDYSNGTKSLIARLVVKYELIEPNEGRCDSDQSIYMVGAPGSLCVERGRRYQGLCYDYRDPTPGYRLVAVIAPIALFSLILYDLFSGVVRQTNY